MKIAFLNQKGGTGKTTLTIHCAHALALKGFRVLLVDSDPQASSLDWAAARSDTAPFTVVGLDRPTLHTELPKLAQGYDHILVDGAPRTNDLSRSAIMASDLILIPIQPSPLDMWAVDELVKLIEESKVYRPAIQAAFVINRRVGNTVIGREAREVLQTYPYPVFDSVISQRIPFAETLNDGNTVLETAPKSPAALEIWALVEELLSAVSEEEEALISG